jgi:hypothetical protein
VCVRIGNVGSTNLSLVEISVIKELIINKNSLHILWCSNVKPGHGVYSLVEISAQNQMAYVTVF